MFNAELIVMQFETEESYYKKYANPCRFSSRCQEKQIEGERASKKCCNVIPCIFLVWRTKATQTEHNLPFPRFVHSVHIGSV